MVETDVHRLVGKFEAAFKGGFHTAHTSEWQAANMLHAIKQDLAEGKKIPKSAIDYMTKFIAGAADENGPVIKNGPALMPIVDAFNAAKQTMAKPKMVIPTLLGVHLVISKAPDNGSNPGCLYVRADDPNAVPDAYGHTDGLYIGRISPIGTFKRNSYEPAPTPELATAVQIILQHLANDLCGALLEAQEVLNACPMCGAGYGDDGTALHPKCVLTFQLPVAPDKPANPLKFDGSDDNLIMSMDFGKAEASVIAHYKNGGVLHMQQVPKKGSFAEKMAALIMQGEHSSPPALPIPLDYHEAAGDAFDAEILEKIEKLTKQAAAASGVSEKSVLAQLKQAFTPGQLSVGYLAHPTGMEKSKVAFEMLKKQMKEGKVSFDIETSFDDVHALLGEPKKQHMMPVSVDGKPMVMKLPNSVVQKLKQIAKEPDKK